MTILGGLRLYLVVVLISISLVIINVEHLFNVLISHFYIFLIEMSIQIICTFKKLCCLFSTCVSQSVVYDSL